LALQRIDLRLLAIDLPGQRVDLPLLVVGLRRQRVDLSLQRLDLLVELGLRLGRECPAGREQA
jgi:hypothetical protein